MSSKTFPHKNFEDEPDSNISQKSLSQSKKIPISDEKSNNINMDSSEYTVNSNMLSSITEISSYNSYRDFSRTSKNETENGSKSLKSNDDNKKSKTMRKIANTLEAILKNSRGRAKTPNKICKFCLYDSSNYQGNLISPCKCRGSLKYVHEECLKTFLIIKKHNLDQSFCETCKAPIKMYIEYDSYFFPNKFKNEGFLAFLIAVLLFLALICLLLLLFIFNVYFTLDFSILDLSENLHNSNFTWVFGLTIFWIILFFAIFIAFIIAFKEAFFIKKISQWKIFNYVPKINEELIEKAGNFTENSFNRWFPLHFCQVFCRKEDENNKIQQKNEFLILFRKEVIIKNPLLEQKINDFKIDKSIDYTLENQNNKVDILKKEKNPSFEQVDKKKTPRKFNFTFRNNPETFNTKPLNLQEEFKSFSQNDQSINISNVIDLEPNNQEIPILRTRSVSISAPQNSFQNTFSKVSKEQLLKDLESFIKTLSKDFIHYDPLKIIKIEILRIVHSYSLEYVRENNKKLDDKMKKNVKANTFETKNHEINTGQSKKRMMSLKKKLNR